MPPALQLTLCVASAAKRSPRAPVSIVRAVGLPGRPPLSHAAAGAARAPSPLARPGAAPKRLTAPQAASAPASKAAAAAKAAAAVAAAKAAGGAAPTVDRVCGVTQGGKMCMRSLGCKYHSVALKRQVQGRSRAFDELLADFHAEQTGGGSSSLLWWAVDARFVPPAGPASAYGPDTERWGGDGSLWRSVELTWYYGKRKPGLGKMAWMPLDEHGKLLRPPSDDPVWGYLKGLKGPT